MRVRQGKTMAELGLTRPRVFRQWKLGSEPAQFGDLSVTEAQIYLATGSDVEAIFLDEKIGDSPGFWAKTDPIYDPHRLVTSADALNRPYIGMQIAIPAQWVEVTVRYSKQTAQTLAKLGRTGRNGYRAAKEQIRSRRQLDPVALDDTTSCGCGFGDNHYIDDDWIELPRVLTSDGVLHVLRVWPVTACGQSDPNWYAARTFEPRRHLEMEKPWQYCPRCWPIAKRRLLDLSREQMMGEAHRSVASEAAENGASWGDLSGLTTWTPGNGIPAFDAPVSDIPVARYSRQVVSFSTPTQTTVQRADVYDASAGPDREDAEDEALDRQWTTWYRRVVASDDLLHIGSVTEGSDILLVCGSEASWYIAYTPGDLIGFQTDFSHKPCPACEAWLAEQPPIDVEKVILGHPSVLFRTDSEPVTVGAGETITSQVGMMTQDSEGIPIIVLTEPKTHLPEILQRCRLAGSRAQARTGINDGSVTIEGWPSIAHRHTFKSVDLDGKLLRIGGRSALRFTAQVGDDSPERTDS